MGFATGFAAGSRLVSEAEERKAREEAEAFRQKLEEEVLALRKKDSKHGRAQDEARTEIAGKSLEEQIRRRKSEERHRYAQMQIEAAERIRQNMREQRQQLQQEIAGADLDLSMKTQNGGVLSMKGTGAEVQRTMGMLGGQLRPASPAEQEAYAEVEIADPSGQGKAKLRVPASRLDEYGFTTPGTEPAVNSAAGTALESKVAELDKQIIEHEMQIAEGDDRFGALNIKSRAKDLVKLKNQKALLIRMQMQRGLISQDEAYRQIQALGLNSK